LPPRITGQIEAPAVDAGSRVGGRVAEVLVREGDRVKAGDLLIRLDDAEATAKLQAAQAQLAQADALVAKLEAGATDEQLRQAAAAAEAANQQYLAAQKGARSQEIAAAAAAAEAARAQRDAADDDFARLEKLIGDGAVTQRQFEQARAAKDAADAQWRAAKEKESLVVAGLRSEEVAAAKAQFDRLQAVYDELRKGARVEDRAAAVAAREAAAAQVALAEVGVRETRVVAPLDAVVESLDVRPGDLVRSGGIVRLVNPDVLELKIYVSAKMLGHLQIGQELSFTTDSHEARPFTGKIQWIASEGEFTPRNLQTQEERVQQVFGVKLALDSHEGALRPGMSATVSLPAAESR
jgi:HlyD family secretion protein